MSQNPTGGLQHLQPAPHKIKIPRRAASYTPATMDSDLRSQLNVQLVAGGHDKKIQEHLLYALNAHSNNWPTQIQARALTLLRSGEATTFPQLLKQILEEVRKETALEAQSSSNGSNGSNGADTSMQANGGNGTPTAGAKKGSGAGPGPGEASNLHQNMRQSLAVPQAVVDEALKVTKDALMSVAEFEEADRTT
ncbi:hypothetical protein BD289DRAFT_447425 [Coniella lustricola]|uniref:Uncharacterized protein n=1 Tax=Coniella lustricola TaxID=2025994 RepID=A0A2T2ZT47_9PEZI|nr:hypothetical protein BD289DRAFT_447425 [Coniella lustricola]